MPDTYILIIFINSVLNWSKILIKNTGKLKQTHPRSDVSNEDWKLSSHDNSMVFKTSRFPIGTICDSTKSPTLSSSVVVTTMVSCATSPDNTTSSAFSSKISGFDGIKYTWTLLFSWSANITNHGKIMDGTDKRLSIYTLNVWNWNTYLELGIFHHIIEKSLLKCMIFYNVYTKNCCRVNCSKLLHYEYRTGIITMVRDYSNE